MILYEMFYNKDSVTETVIHLQLQPVVPRQCYSLPHWPTKSGQYRNRRGSWIYVAVVRALFMDCLEENLNGSEICDLLILNVYFLKIWTLNSLFAWCYLSPFKTKPNKTKTKTKKTENKTKKHPKKFHLEENICSNTFFHFSLGKVWKRFKNI